MMAANKQPIVVRIKTQQGEDMDWTMSSPHTRFSEVMGVVAQVLQHNSATAFEYEDEDGDRVTVRGDAEMEAMMVYMRSVTADAITERVVSFLEESNLEVHKLAGFGSDGASVMVGRVNGVATQLKRLSPMIVSCHCVAHRLALAMSDTGKRIPYVKKFNDLLQMLYQYYDASPIRSGGLRTIQESLEDPVLKPKRALTTRWLLHDHACATMRQILTSVIISLGREAAERDDPKAIGLLKLASQWKFVATLYMMCDILPKLSELSRRFQRKDLSYTDIHEKLADTIEQLQTALVVPGKFTRQRDDVIGRMNAAGINLKNPMDADDFKENVHDAFIKAVIDNIEERFPQTDLMDSFKIFDCDVEKADAIQPRSLKYLHILSECEARHVMAPPLCIYPKLSRAMKRTVPGLTVNTRPVGPVPKGADSGISLHFAKHEAELREILSRGRIAETDIVKLKLLGRGQSGTVWKAIHVPTSTEIAIKVIQLDITQKARKQIMSELQVLYKCDCPCIISYYGSFFRENQISMCTEYMDGGSLERYSPIPEAILGRIAVSVVKGLNYLWNFKILHRDIKPSNILVNTRGDVKLCDFGVSTQLIDSIAKTYIGTNAYMAPERVLGHEYGVHSEVWSVGLFLLEMATGRFPYPVSHKGNNLAPIAVLQCIVNEIPPRLSVEKFSQEFSDFVASCMEKEPSQRPSPEQVLQHQFIRKYDDNDKQMMGYWVFTQLQEQEGVAS